MKRPFSLGLWLSLSLLSQVASVSAKTPNECLIQQESPNYADITIENISAETRQFLLALVANWDNRITFCPDLGDWTVNLNSDVDLTLGSNNVFGGLTASLEGNVFKFVSGPLSQDDDLAREDAGELGADINTNSSLGHSFVFSGGVQTDAAFQNLSLLVEAGYVPIVVNALPGLTLGTNLTDQSRIIIGTYIQGGYTTTLGTNAEVSPTQEDEASVDSGGALLRFQLWGEGEIRLPLQFAEIQGVRIIPEAWVWYDVLDNQVYGLLEGTLTLDITDKVSYNLVGFKHGSQPPDFAPGAQFSTGLTISF